MPTIRIATPDDAETILSFIHGLAAYEREPDAVEVDAATLREQLASGAPPFECLLAFDGERAVGFALYFTSYSTWRGRPGIYLEDLFVPESERGKGVGRALLVELARTVVARGGARLEWAVLDWNEPAIGFYQRLGAGAQSEWTTYRLDGDALARLANETTQQ